MKLSRFLSRMQFIGTYSFGQLLPGIFNLLFSLVIIRKHGTSVWGEIVILQVITHFAIAFLSFGSKEFLIKGFSEKPASVNNYFMLSFSTRSLLLLPVLLIIWIFLPAENFIKGTLIVWVLARYISNSFDPYIIFRRRFTAAILAEAIPCILLLLILLIGKNDSFEQMLFFFSAAYLLKAMLGMFFFRDLFKNASFTLNLNYFRISVPFAALTVTGIIQSRADLLIVGMLMPAGELASYQVLTSFLILMHGIPAFIVSPFVSNLYRGDTELENKIRRQVILAGFFISLLGIGSLYFIIPWLYHFSFAPLIYLLAFFYVFSSYLFYLDIYRCFRLGKSGTVLLISLCAAVSNMAACFALIPHWGIAGAMAANLVSQCLLWLFFMIAVKRPSQRNINPDI